MDNLQTLWRNAKQAESSAPLPPVEIKKIIRRKSGHEFDRFQRVVRWEIMLNIPITVSIVIWLTIRGGSERIFLVPILIFVGVSYFVWQYLFYKRMKQHQLKEDVYHYLREGLVILERYVLNYKIITAASLGLGLLVGFLTAENIITDSQHSAFTIVDDPYQNLVIVFIIADLLLIGIFLNIKHQYQPKINRMWQLLAELQREA